jgi:DNA-binding transcriptional LysR family regulator
MRMRKRHPVSKADNQWLLQTSLGSRIALASLIQALTVAEYLNFRHAADALGTSQSSVSARIRALEQELGILLFERNTRGVKLTEAGRCFIERVAAGVEQLDIAVKSARMAATGERGRLRIGVHGLIAGSFLDNLLAEYRKTYPYIAIKMVEATARDAVMYLRSDRIDVAFVVGEPNLPDCHSRPIWTEQLMAALAADHCLAHQTNVSWEQLVSERFLVRHNGTGPQVYDHIVLRLAGRWPAPEIQRHDVERSTLLSMVAQGFGITLLGAASGLSPIGGVVFLPIIDEPGPIIFSAVWSPKDRSPTLRNLFKLAARIDRNSGLA